MRLSLVFDRNGFLKVIHGLDSCPCCGCTLEYGRLELKLNKPALRTGRGWSSRVVLDVLYCPLCGRAWVKDGK